MLAKIPEKLLPFLEKEKRIKVAIGGRGGGKSIGVGDLLILKAHSEKAGIMCLREFQNSIDDSVHALLKSEINRLGVPGATSFDNKIDFNSGGWFRYKGMSRGTDSTKSTFGFKYSWVEEAQFMSQKSIDTLLPSIREEGSECWFTGNPGSSEDPFSKEFITPYYDELMKNGYYEDDIRLIVLINWNDNPWFPDVLNEQRLDNRKHWSPAKYEHIWEGYFSDEVENSIILSEWFDAAVDAHLKKGFKARGQKILAHDPSDSGPDPAAYGVRHGSVVLDVKSYDEKDVNDNCDVAIDAAIRNNVDVFVWDGDGLGASLKRQVSKAVEGKKITCDMFRGSEKPDRPDEIYQSYDSQVSNQKTNQQTFKNSRAHHYWMLRDRFYNTYRCVVKGEYVDPDEMISISSDIKDLSKLRSEVCRIPEKPNGNGLIQIMTKIEMLLKHQIKSPNMADVLMMLMKMPKVRKWGKLNYEKVSMA